MKKYFFITAMIFATGALTVSCDRTSDNSSSNVDNDTFSQMKDVSATFSAANNYASNTPISIPNTDVVLVYRNVNSNIAGTSPVWQLLPKTFYLSNNREIDYNFVFNSEQVQITTEANFDQSTLSPAEKNSYLNTQTFRIVLVPASAGRNSAVDYNDYNSVVKFYNLKEPRK